jgi:osmotically-inducible protein OsmY
MKAFKNLKLISIFLLVAVGLVACNKPGPAESAGKKIDQVVEDTGKKIDEKSDKMGTALNDSEITTKVKAAIFAEPGLKSLQISVDTVNGVVTLSGSVDTQQNSDKANALAAAVSGVKGVENRMIVK